MLPLRDSIPSSRLPFINTSLIVVNALVFLYEVSLPTEQLQAFMMRWAAVPAAFNPGSPAFQSPIESVPRLFSSMFLHGSLVHVGFNMLFLWVFGDNVEDRVGHIPYFLFYLVCGVVAAFTQVFFSYDSQIPIVGASGAIGGVMGAYMVLHPRARVLTFFWFFIIIRFFWIPALFYLGLWFALQLLQAIGSTGAIESNQGGVAFWAHVGGFAAGVVLIVFIKKKEPRRRLQSRTGDNFPIYSTRRTWR